MHKPHTFQFSNLKATFSKYELVFKQPGGTSRGILMNKTSWFIKIWEASNPEISGIGECSPLKGLSIDFREDFEKELANICNNIQSYSSLLETRLNELPSINFGLETALIDLANKGEKILYPSGFTQGKDSIDINGLIWMGDTEFMKQQIDEKINQGFRCIKMKIGAIDFEKELSLLRYIRQSPGGGKIELRVDANGAFTVEEALSKLERLSELHIHSIEQPIRQGNPEQMAELCKKTPVPIALDEELIGVNSYSEKQALLEQIKPQYIILKPTLVGGLSESEEWINVAEAQNVGWWVTSALESNIGLNAIAQWTYTLKNSMPQGLGTGQLFTNNIKSPLYLQSDKLFHNPHTSWNIKSLQ